MAKKKTGKTALKGVRAAIAREKQRIRKEELQAELKALKKKKGHKKATKAPAKRRKTKKRRY